MVAFTCSPRHLGGRGGRIAWAWEMEATVSCSCATALQVGWQSETLPQKIKNKMESYIMLSFVSGLFHLKMLVRLIYINRNSCTLFSMLCSILLHEYTVGKGYELFPVFLFLIPLLVHMYAYSTGHTPCNRCWVKVSPLLNSFPEWLYQFTLLPASMRVTIALHHQ